MAWSGAEVCRCVVMISMTKVEARAAGPLSSRQAGATKLHHLPAGLSHSQHQSYSGKWARMEVLEARCGSGPGPVEGGLQAVASVLQASIRLYGCLDKPHAPDQASCRQHKCTRPPAPYKTGAQIHQGPQGHRRGKDPPPTGLGQWDAGARASRACGRVNPMALDRIGGNFRARGQ